MLRIKKDTMVLDVAITSTGIVIQQVVTSLPSSRVNRNHIRLLIQSLEIIARHQLRLRKEEAPQKVLEDYFESKGWSIGNPVSLEI